MRRFGLRVGKIAKQVHVVEISERPRQFIVDELERTAHRFDADLDENAGRFLDVVAGGLNEPGRLAQFREHASCSLGRRRVREERLPREARRDQIGIELRIAFPGPHDLEIEHARLQIGGQHAMLEPLDRRQRVLLDFVETPQIPRERMGLAVDRVTTQIFKKVVVRMHSIQRRVCGVRLMKKSEQVVDEMGKGFRNNHRSMTSREEPTPDTAELRSAQIRQWYNN